MSLSRNLLLPNVNAKYYLPSRDVESAIEKVEKREARLNTFSSIEGSGPRLCTPLLNSIT